MKTMKTRRTNVPAVFLNPEQMLDKFEFLYRRRSLKIDPKRMENLDRLIVKAHRQKGNSSARKPITERLTDYFDKVDAVPAEKRLKRRTRRDLTRRVGKALRED